MPQSRQPSPLQRRGLIVLAALDEKRPDPVLTRGFCDMSRQQRLSAVME
ncbi:TPA: hypothetical protein IGZ58_004497 [Escherichia coli]|nr:hypothetical protein [Escherichia coli]